MDVGLEPTMYHCMRLQPTVFAARLKSIIKLAPGAGLEPARPFGKHVNSVSQCHYAYPGIKSDRDYIYTAHSIWLYSMRSTHV